MISLILEEGNPQETSQNPIQTSPAVLLTNETLHRKFKKNTTGQVSTDL